MNTSKLRNSTAIDKALAITAIQRELEMKQGDDGEQAQTDQPTLHKHEIADSDATADQVTTYLRQVSASSSGEIDTLMTDLRGLRDKLVNDCVRVEQNVIEFAVFNESVIKLTRLISESIAQVSAPQPAQ